MPWKATSCALLDEIAGRRSSDAQPASSALTMTRIAAMVRGYTRLNLSHIDEHVEQRAGYAGAADLSCGMPARGRR
jgi:hypothetical protein